MPRGVRQKEKERGSTRGREREREREGWMDEGMEGCKDGDRGGSLRERQASKKENRTCDYDYDYWMRCPEG